GDPSEFPAAFVDRAGLADRRGVEHLEVLEILVDRGPVDRRQGGRGEGLVVCEQEVEAASALEVGREGGGDLSGIAPQTVVLLLGARLGIRRQQQPGREQDDADERRQERQSTHSVPFRPTDTWELYRPRA